MYQKRKAIATLLRAVFFYDTFFIVFRVDDFSRCYYCNAFTRLLENHSDDFIIYKYVYIYIYIYIYINPVINPTSNNLGKVSKRILDMVNNECRDTSGVNQWRSTQDVLKWFSDVHSANPTKDKAKFLQFDICEFYPSITEDLLRNSLNFAKSHTPIDQADEDKKERPFQQWQSVDKEEQRLRCYHGCSGWRRNR